MQISPEMETKIPLIKISTTAHTTLTTITQTKKVIAAEIDLFHNF
jgi:hypothetical protein